MSTERGFECISHTPPLTSEAFGLSDQDLREAYRDREFLAKVLRRFGNVDNDHGLTAATAWLCEHMTCEVGAWNDNSVYRTRLGEDGSTMSYTLQELRGGAS